MDVPGMFSYLTSRNIVDFGVNIIDAFNAIGADKSRVNTSDIRGAGPLSRVKTGSNVEEEQAIELFVKATDDHQANEELAAIYLIYAGFEPEDPDSSRFSSAEERHDEAVKYLEQHAEQKQILQAIFPLTDNLEQEASEKKMDLYGDYCWKLQQNYSKRGDHNAYMQALKTSKAIVTLFYALSVFAEENLAKSNVLLEGQAL
jgi:hypothetical protein